MNVEDIRRLKTHYIDRVYSDTRAQQSIDQSYRDDTFPVPEIQAPHHIYRSGIGARMVDAPAEQIVTSNPQAFINVVSKRGETKVRTESEERFSREANGWLRIMRRANPNIFKEFPKSLLSRGDGFIQISHNPTWVKDPITKLGIPILFTVPDSSIIYASPEEDNDGVPEKVIIFYKRTLVDVIAKYPHMNDLLPTSVKEAGEVDWLEYWDNEIHYAEIGIIQADKAIDGIPVYGGIQPNIYKRVPFVHKYSGFGIRAPDGQLSKLIVSGLKMARDLLREECAIRSDIASIMHLYAQPGIDMIRKQDTDLNADDLRENYDLGPGQVNILPPGVTPTPRTVMLPSAEAFQYHRDIITRLEMMNPFIVAGFPFGSSGRQDDRAMMTAMHRFDTVIENTENAFATALEIGFEIARIVPTLWGAIGLLGKDKDATIEIDVKLRASDLAEKDRLATLGERLWNGGDGSIDLRTNLTQYKNYTDDEAEDIIANLLVDKLTLFNPQVAQVMAMVFAQESGMQRWLEMAQQQQIMQEQTGTAPQGALAQPQTPTDQLRAQGEAVNLDMVDQSLQNRGARTPPARSA